jgi:hypothetical protein
MLPILLALAFIALLIFVAIAGRPDEFRVTRSVIIPASPATVFAQVNDLHAWEAWSPWAKLDPNAKSTFEGPTSGTGASMGWSGNKKIGEGRMTITESRANEWIGFKLEFVRPFKATNMAEFTFRPEGNQTVVNWSMSGKNNLGGKVFSLFMNCDDMIGKDFEKGLANLKSVVEKK